MLSAVLGLSWLIILIGTTAVSVGLPMFTRRLVVIKLIRMVPYFCFEVLKKSFGQFLYLEHV
ncbi:hypothetical protein OIU76_008171 [Salix suchowensis]|nr:hypothetical protein OIU76_008171 [Salix suchowensis]